MKTEGKSRIEGAKCPRFEGEARIEGAARDKTGGGVWGGSSVSPSPENFCRIKSEMVQSGASKLPDKQTSLICPDADKNPMGSSKIELNRPGPVQQQQLQQQQQQLGQQRQQQHQGNGKQQQGESRAAIKGRRGRGAVYSYTCLASVV